MYGPIYHLKYLFTSDASQIHDLNRLEYLSACAILQDVNILQKLWPTVPVHFVKPLSHACICKIFYIQYEEDCIFSSSLLDKESNVYKKCQKWILSLRYLIQNWPDEEFMLKDILPMLHKPTNHSLSKKRNNPIKTYCTKLTHLRSMLLSDVVAPVLKQKKSVNIFDFTDYYDFLPMTSFPFIDKGVSNMLTEMEDNSLFENEKMFGLKFDCEIVISSKDHYLYLCKLIQLIDKLYMISLPKVKLTNNVTSKRTRPHVTLFFKILVSTNTKYLTVSIGDFSDNTAQSISKTLPNLLGLYIEDNTTLMSLEFLSDFTDLKHLGLSGINLHGKLNHLNKLSKGLQYLQLRKCYLEGDDLVCLKESFHLVSLKQFEVELNTCSVVEGFLKLCPHLINIEVLKVKSGKQLEMNTHQIERLLNFVTVLPKLAILTLELSTSLEVLLQHLPLVVRNSSLKILTLSICDRRDNEEMEELIEKLHTKCMNACNIQNNKLEFNIILL